MDLDDWRELNRVRVKNLYTAMRALYDSVAGPSSFLVSATRLGGLHGYGDAGATAPLGGAVIGFTKAYNIEQGMRRNGKGVMVKAVDFEVSRKTVEPADQLIAETLSDPGIVEVGYYEGLRYTVTLVENCRPRTASRAWCWTRTPSSSSPARPAASPAPSPPTWQSPAAASSTCWTWCPARRATTSTSALPPGTVRRSSAS